MPNKLAKNHDSSIQYKQFFDGDLCGLLTTVNRWLKKNVNIHIWDIVIDGAAGFTADWQATIYYFEGEEENEPR